MESVKKPLGKGASIVLLAIILVLIFVGYFFIILKPLLTQITDIQSEVIQTQTTLDSLRLQQQKYLQMQQALQRTEEAGTVIPHFDNEPALLYAMNSIMSKASSYSIGTDINLGLDENTTNNSVLRRSFNIVFSCQNIWQAQNLMDELTKIPYRSQISAFSLVSEDGAPEALTNIWNSSINGDLIITFYEAK